MAVTTYDGFIVGLLAFHVAAFAAVALVLAYMLWRMTGAFKSLQRFDARLTQLAQAMSLLTETSELGFNATAVELSRVGEVVRRRPSARDVARRMARAASGGRPVHQIAAEERMSESEVRLRIGMAEADRRRPARDDRDRGRPAGSSTSARRDDEEGGSGAL